MAMADVNHEESNIVVPEENGVKHSKGLKVAGYLVPWWVVVVVVLLLVYVVYLVVSERSGHVVTLIPRQQTITMAPSMTGGFDSGEIPYQVKELFGMY